MKLKNASIICAIPLRSQRYRPFRRLPRAGAAAPRNEALTDLWVSALGSLQIQHEPLRVLQALLDAHQERHGLAAVDDAVVVAQGEVHHRPGHDLAVPDHGLLLDAVHAKNARL